jgi:hypothetical protein
MNNNYMVFPNISHDSIPGTELGKMNRIKNTGKTACAALSEELSLASRTWAGYTSSLGAGLAGLWQAFSITAA